jgi:surfactin synthase thioesterase subunit
MLSLHRSRPALGEPSLRLFWFHHAGGTGQSYRSWIPLFPHDWDIVFVEYPGRGHNAQLPLARSLTALSDLILPNIESLLDVPYAMCGHSMGSLVAFTMARLASEWSDRPPLWLGVSGRHAPHLAVRAVPALHELSDPELADAIRAMGGTPAHLLFDPQFRDQFLAVMRADFEVCATHIAPRTPRLDVPISACFGSGDATVSPAAMRAWGELTTAELRLREFPGGHFFLAAHKAEFARSMIADIAAADERAALRRSTPHIPQRKEAYLP